MRRLLPLIAALAAVGCGSEPSASEPATTPAPASTPQAQSTAVTTPTPAGGVDSTKPFTERGEK